MSARPMTSIDPVVRARPPPINPLVPKRLGTQLLESLFVPRAVRENRLPEPTAMATIPAAMVTVLVCSSEGTWHTVQSSAKTPIRYGARTVMAMNSERRHSRIGFATAYPTRRPRPAPAITSLGKCDPWMTRPAATRPAVLYRIHAAQGKCLASTAATANEAMVWPDGKESSPLSQEGPNWKPLECVIRGLGRPIKCLST